MLFTFCDQCHAILQNGGGHFPWCAIVQREIDLLRLEISAMTLPTQPDFDWGSLTVHAVERLRAPKTAPVPPAIVKLAQTSYEGVIDPQNPEGPRLHVLRHTFEDQERAGKFAGHLRNAGKLTTPQTSTTIVVNPDNLNTPEGRADWRESNPGIDMTDEQLTDLGGRTVAWKTGASRKRHG